MLINRTFKAQKVAGVYARVLADLAWPAIRYLSRVFPAKSGRFGFAVSLSCGEFTPIPKKQFPYWDMLEDSFSPGVANPNNTC